MKNMKFYKGPIDVCKLLDLKQANVCIENWGEKRSTVRHARKIATSQETEQIVEHELNQGPLMKWTEYSQELDLLKIHSRGAPITP